MGIPSLSTISMAGRALPYLMAVQPMNTRRSRLRRDLPANSQEYRHSQV